VYLAPPTGSGANAQVDLFSASCPHRLCYLRRRDDFNPGESSRLDRSDCHSTWEIQSAGQEFRFGS
jgi:hypothetical protein